MARRFGSPVLALVVAAGIGASAACASLRRAEPLAVYIPHAAPAVSPVPTAPADALAPATVESYIYSVKYGGTLIKSADVEPALADAVQQCVQRQGATYQADCDANGYGFTGLAGVCSLVSQTAEDAKRHRVRVLLIPPLSPTASGADELRTGTRLVIFERRGTTWVALSDEQAFRH